MKNSEILHKYFGFNTFKDIQEEVINNLLVGHNTLCLMPTGGGKSIIYQVAGIQTGKITIVISPLLALMKQQNKRLAEQGINVMSYNSSLGDLKTQFNTLKKVFSGQNLPQFIFVSPEKIISDGYLEFILKKHHSKIGLIVIDEAHCVSQWGNTFRPAYKTIPLFIHNVFGAGSVPPLLCLTATLNPNDKHEICKDLSISESNIFISNTLLRRNLQLSILDQVENNEQKKAQLKDVLNKHKNEKVIVYTHIKARDYGTREMSKAFRDLGFNCHYFDADMQDEEKLSILEQFESGLIKIVFATSAFGMGIDIPDIRAVVHYLLPESIEQYYQEVGRAGRDGKDAFGYLLYSQTNFKIRRDLIKKSLITQSRIVEIFDNTIRPVSSTSLKRKMNATETNSFEKIYSLNRMDIKEDNSEMVIFLMLLQYEVIKLQGKGLQFFDCFEDNGSKLYSLMKEASINGMVSRISKKLNKSIEHTNQDIYIMFNQDEIKLTRAPTNVLNYSVNKSLSTDIVDEIYINLKKRMENRMENFEKLSAFIERREDPIKVIANHLGVLNAEY